jgi:hypothetical protein
MASFTDKITLVVDVVTGRSSSSPLKSIRDDIDQTDGAFSKFKVGASGALDAVKANAGLLAAGAGAAIAAFAVKAVGDFQSISLGAGELRDKLGVTADEASRWQEVAGDLGISVGTLETAMGKMLRTAGSSPDVFKQLGVDIAYAKDGSVDANGTFLNVIDRLNGMKDPAERAAAAQQLLGKSWMDSAELIRLGADGVRDRLAEVADAKIVTDDQIDQARDMRDSLDDLKDAGENLTLAVGSALTPAVAGFGQALADVIGPFSEFLIKLDSADMDSEAAAWEKFLKVVKDAGSNPLPSLNMEGIADSPAVLQLLTEGMSDANFQMIELTAAAQANRAELDGHETAVDADAEAQKEFEASTRAAAKALRDQADELEAAVDAMPAAADCVFM